MLRKLVMLAITSGLAKKAWDSYKAKGQPMASSGGGSFGRTGSVRRTPNATSTTATPRSGDKPDAY